MYLRDLTYVVKVTYAVWRGWSARKVSCVAPLLAQPDFTRCGILHLNATDYTVIVLECRAILLHLNADAKRCYQPPCILVQDASENPASCINKASAQPLRALLRVGLSSGPELLRVNLSSGPSNSE